jgi:hypothetical protein
MNAWSMMKATGRSTSQTLGLEGLLAYAVDQAVVHWGTSFEAAMQAATQGAKKPADAEKAAAREVRKWLPSQRRYADPSRR